MSIRINLDENPIPDDIYRSFFTECATKAIKHIQISEYVKSEEWSKKYGDLEKCIVHESSTEFIFIIHARYDSIHEDVYALGRSRHFCGKCIESWLGKEEEELVKEFDLKKTQRDIISS